MLSMNYSPVAEVWASSESSDLRNPEALAFLGAVRQIFYLGFRFDSEAAICARDVQAPMCAVLDSESSQLRLQ